MPQPRFLRLFNADSAPAAVEVMAVAVEVMAVAVEVMAVGS
mgnify:CR=1 FL=1